MKQKNRVRIGLDLILVMVMAVLYKKNVISLAFHEIAGLVLFGCLVVHLVLNGKWIRVISIRILDAALPKRTKVSYVVNLLLFVAWFLVGLGGVLISKIVFSFSVPGPWKGMHITGSAVALALTGVHVGLHWNFIRNMSRRWLLHLGKSAKPVGVVLLVAVMVFGAYSMVDSNYISWLSMPFSSSESHDQRGIKSSSGQQEVILRGGKSMGVKGYNQQFSLLNLLQTLACFFSIMMVFAILTAFINWKLTHMKRISIPVANPICLSPHTFVDSPEELSTESPTSAIPCAGEYTIEEKNQ